MRLGWTTGKYSTTYRAVKTIRVGGKNKTLIVKNFGSDRYICKTFAVTDLALNDQHCFNGGYLFLQDIYHEPGLDRICTSIKSRHDFDYTQGLVLLRGREAGKIRSVRHRAALLSAGQQAYRPRGLC